MNAPGIQGGPSAWTGRRLGGLMLVLLLGQSGLLWLLARVPGTPGNPVRRAAPAFAAQVPSAGTAAAWVEWLGAPTRFAGGDDGAFARAARQAAPRLDYPLAEWREPARWMGAAAVRLGVPPVTSSSIQAEVPAPPPLPAGPVPALGPDRTVVRIEGALAARRLRGALDAPSQGAADVLPPTTVEVAVTPQGDPLLVRVKEGSGVKAVDELALRVVRAARWEDLDPGARRADYRVGSLTWGTVLFRWHSPVAAR